MQVPQFYIKREVKGDRMKKTIFTGSGVAIVTPMNEDQSINYKAFEELLEFQMAHKTDAIIVAGTTGEASTLSDEEHLDLIRFAVEKVNGRLPVIAGAGSNDTRHAVKLSIESEKAGADALLLVTPYYNKASQQGIYLHFKSCADAVKLPIILYNVPSRTGVNIGTDTYQRLSEIDNIVATKEASGNFSQLAKIASVCKDNLHIYSGNDDQITSSLALGAKGVISVLANVVPEDTHNICECFFNGDTNESDNLQLQYLELIEGLFSDINPIPVKQALKFMGYDVGSCRLPLCDMDSILKEKLYAVMQKYNLCSKNDIKNVGTVTAHRPENLLLWRKNH